MKFSELNLSAALIKAVDDMGFEETTPIQSQAIPMALAGQDIFGQAQTGTGKTAAFGLPLLEKLDTNKEAIQALIVEPTRELAVQTGEEMYHLGKHQGTKVVTVYGGAAIGRQIQLLKKHPSVVVGTPGRLLDLIQRKALRLDAIETVVLDEADEMLNMGFIDDIEAILKQVPEQRQTLLFSATVPSEIKRISQQFMTDPHHVKIEAKEMTADLIDQYFTKCRDYEKFDILTRFIDIHNPDLAIVFARTKRRVDEVARGLIERGYTAEGIHGDLTQQKRLQVLKDFKAGKLNILVATDVAARGLDIGGVSHVYNFDIPQDPESYVHRIGRTGRAGKEGMSVTFVINHEMDYLRTIENLTRKKLSPLRPPTSEEAFTGQMRASVDRVADLVESEENMAKYEDAVAYLGAQYTQDQLAYALMKALTKDPSDVKVKITPEKTLPHRNKKGRKNYKQGGHRKRQNHKQGKHSNKNHGKNGKHAEKGKGKKPGKPANKSGQHKQSKGFKIR
ncbi:DEAD/DEAH box helicase [Aerococcus kribbianus]|uniref:ATP-dependent RNA helicase CshA n=1 Tax=Aerococcus kribbianus TaxID=2999064 RepID=A0A9X3FNM6_9LACT|nr:MULTISPECIES: DEAD/DEAH box helicase [unclassified Aerococcus]MCZ0717883.1 DEAD/DEAH box helicase [Aerococcus sp. YH-aer221]MCZ0726170.1 DEAD/DEAH box helicase [Aerococcus sp. YH-aer222]